MEVADELILAKDYPNGFTYTLASRLGGILQLAEKLFGPRDREYACLGIEFYTRDHPQIWYPGNCRHIVIQLSLAAASDVRQAIYQLAIEAIHLLSPSGSNASTVVEEGLGEVLAAKYFEQAGLAAMHSNGPKYIRARDLVQTLLSIDPGIIKRLRARKPTLSVWNAEDILKANPNVSAQLAADLVQAF